MLRLSRLVSEPSGRVDARPATSVFRQSAVVFAGSTALSIGGFVFHAIASRLLGVATYGTLYTLISLNTLASLPGAVLNPVVSRFAAEFRAVQNAGHLRGLVADLWRLCVFVGSVYIAFAVLLAAPAVWYLGLPAWGLPIVGLIAAATFALMVLRGFAQGMHDFGSYAYSSAVEGVTKVLALAVFAAVGMRLFAGTLGFLVGTLCGVAMVAWSTMQRTSRIAPVTPSYDWSRIALSSMGAAAMIVATNCMGSLDVVLVRHFFSARDAGLYSAASLGGRAVLYLVNFAPLVMLPSVTDRFARGARTRRPFWESFGLLLALALCAVLGLQIAGAQLLHALVGHAFDASLPLLLPYGLAMMLLAATNLIASYGVATHRLGFAGPLVVGTLATLGVIASVHPSLLAVTRELLIGNAVICLLVAGALVFQRKPRRAVMART